MNQNTYDNKKIGIFLVLKHKKDSLTTTTLQFVKWLTDNPINNEMLKEQKKNYNCNL